MGVYIVLGVVLITMAYIFFNYYKIKRLEEGNEEMQEMAQIIRDGSNTFLKTEYKAIVVVVILLALILSLFVEKSSGLTLLIGAAMSSSACIIGMKSATYANVRTANTAKKTLSVGETVRVVAHAVVE